MTTGKELTGWVLSALSPQDLCQALESLSSTVTAFSASAQKVVNRESSTQETAALQQQYEEILHKAKERQKALEDLLAHWQRWAALGLLSMVDGRVHRNCFLGQWFSIFLRLRPFNTLPHVITLSTIKSLLLLLPNYSLATVMNHNVIL